MSHRKIILWHFLQGEASYKVFVEDRSNPIEKSDRNFCSHMKKFSKNMCKLAGCESIAIRPMSGASNLTEWDDLLRSMGQVAQELVEGTGKTYTYCSVRTWKFTN